MAAITSTGSGTWPSALSATPTSADDVTISGLHAVTNSGTAVCKTLTLTPTAGTTSLTNSGTLTVGDTATLGTALSWTPSASTATPAFVNTGTLSLKGNVLQGNSPYQVGGGSVTEFVSTTHAGSMTWSVGTASNQNNAAVKSSGTTLTSRATFRAVSATARFTAGAFFGAARWQVQYATFSGGLGSSSVDAVQANADNSTGAVVFDDCLFDGVGKVTSTQNFGASNTVAVRRSVFKNSLNTTTCLNFSGGVATGVTGTHELLDNSFDSGVRINCGLHIQRNLFNTPALQAPITLTASNFALSWDKNVLVSLLGTTSMSLSFGSNIAATGATNTIWAFVGTNTNPHPLTLANAAGTSQTLDFAHWFFDFGSAGWTSDAVGDFVDIFAPATVGVKTTLRFRNFITNGNAAGFGGGHLFRLGSSAVASGTLDVQIEHCNHYSDGGSGTFNSECPVVNFGEPTATIPDGTITSFKSNLITSPSGRGGSLMCRYGTSNGTVAICAPANATNNAAWQAGTGAGADGYGYARASGANATFASAPGTVLNANPSMVAPTRSLATWDTSLGGAGTIANAMAEMAKQYDPTQTWNPAYTFTAAQTYLEGGQKPTNAAYNAAHDAGAPTTTALGWIGAVAGTPALAAGTMNAAGSITATSAGLSWSAATNGTSPYTYQVQLSPDAGGTWGNAGTSTSGTSKALSGADGLGPATTYSARVVVTDSAGTPATATSNAVAFTTDTALAAGVLSSGTVTATTAQLTWTAATHGTPSYTYQLQRAPGGSTTFVNVSGGVTSPVTDSGLTASASYDYRVTATDSTGATEITNTKNVVAAAAGGVLSVTTAPANISISPGTTVQLTATVVTQGGTAQTVTWGSSSGSVATVSASGLVTGVGAGSATITATSTADGSKSSAVGALVSSGARRFAVDAVRFVRDIGGTTGPAATFCPYGIPLTAGMLSPAQFAAGFGKLLVNGVEIPRFLEAPTGPGAYHTDGSLRCVYCQSTPTLTYGSPLAGEFRCDELPSAGMTAAFVDPSPYWVAPTTAATNNADVGGVRYADIYNLPGVVVPSSAAQICDSGLFEYTRPTTENPTTGAEATMVAALDAWWASAEAGYVLGSTTDGFLRWDGRYQINVTGGRQLYYERPYTYWSWWARSGNTAFLKEGLAQWFRRTTVYDALPANDWASIGDFSYMPRADMLASWLLRDTRARDRRLKKMASDSYPAHTTQPPWLGLGNATRQTGEARVQSNALRCHVAAHLTGVTTTTYGAPFTIAQTLTSLRKAICDTSSGAPALNTTPSWGLADKTGGLTYGPTQRIREPDIDQNPAVNVLVALPFQNQLFVRALRWCYDYLDLSGVVGLRALVLSRIQSILDQDWTNLLYANNPNPTYTASSGPSFSFASIHYNSGGVNGGPKYAVDLNMFAVDLYYWYAWRTGDLSYVTKGDALLAAATRLPHDGERGAYHSDPKQAVEQFQFAPQAPGLRTLAVTAAPTDVPTAAPAITLSPVAGTTLRFAQTVGLGPTAEQTVTVLNSGTGALDAITIGATGTGASYVTATLDDTVAPTVARITCDPGAGAVGSYTASVNIASTAVGITNSPQSIPVAFDIVPVVVIGANPLATLLRTGSSSQAA